MTSTEEQPVEQPAIRLTSMPQTFFIPDGDAWIPTENTRGPWSNAHQHGGRDRAL